MSLNLHENSLSTVVLRRRLVPNEVMLYFSTGVWISEIHY